MAIKNRLKYILLDNDMSIAQLAERIGITYSIVYDFANMRRRSVQFDLLDAICQELDISPGDMLIHEPGEKGQG